MSGVPVLGRKFVPTVLLAAVIWLTAGCATQQTKWDPRVGNYTYDQAIREYGPPDKQAKLQDGTLVVEWLTRRGYAYSEPEPLFYSPYYYGYGSAFPIYHNVHVPDYYLRLTFGPDGKLTAWKNFAR